MPFCRHFAAILPPRLCPLRLQIVSLTELMAGVKAAPKTCQVFQLLCWPEGHKVPTSTNALVELMNMVERWRQRTDYGPVIVISPYATSPLLSISPPIATNPSGFASHHLLKHKESQPQHFMSQKNNKKTTKTTKTKHERVPNLFQVKKKKKIRRKSQRNSKNLGAVSRILTINKPVDSKIQT